MVGRFLLSGRMTEKDTIRGRVALVVAADVVAVAGKNAPVVDAVAVRIVMTTCIILVGRQMQRIWWRIGLK